MLNYYLITKPGIILGNLVTVAAGFLLASKGTFNFWLFLATLLGLTLIIASACVFNNYIDREIDKKMERTKNRPLATGIISKNKALLFGTLLALAGAWSLYRFTNILTLMVTAVGFFTYVFLYSMWKGRTIYGTAIGSISGATPPVIGYCAVSGQFDAGAMVLFAMMIFWQMPHFFSIAMYHFDDYAAANIPVLPIKKGIDKTKRRMVLYIVCFLFATPLLTIFGYTGYLYFAAAAVLGVLWLALCLRGYKREDTERWACQMFRLSLIIITALCLVIPFDIA